jgi:hypothetical protein
MKINLPLLAIVGLVLPVCNSQAGIGFGATLNDCREAFGQAMIFNKGTTSAYYEFDSQGYLIDDLLAFA